jgi:hypothetical protein
MLSEWIQLAEVVASTARTIVRLDESFFRARFDRLTNSEKRYLRAMAELGEGPYRTSEIAAKYGAVVNSVAPIRGNLIREGMIYSPGHGPAPAVGRRSRTRYLSSSAGSAAHPVENGAK